VSYIPIPALLSIVRADDLGFVTLFLWYMDPPSVRPLVTTLSIGLVSVLTLDFFRLKYPGFAEVWENYFGFLMRESERDQINGVVWYLIGVIFVLTLYPRDVAVVSILT
jgi:diacylglycerol kinase (CTP)